MTPSEADELDLEIIELKQELLRIGQLKEQSEKNRALENFIPHPKQRPFFANADKEHRAGFTGNRFGKTTMGVVEDSSWLLGERVFFGKDNPLRRLGIPNHGVKGLVLSEDWDKVYELFTNNDSVDKPGKFFEFLPKDKIIGTTRMQKGVINSITTRNTIDGRNRESLLVFDTVRSFINNPRSFESSDWDFIHVDEPIMQELWTAVSRGLIDRGGKAWWLLTPLGFPWMYDTMVTKCVNEPQFYWMFEASMDDNPTLNSRTRDAYLADLPEGEVECRKSGTPLAHGRRVYGHFNEKVHVWQGKEHPIGWSNWTTPGEDYLCGYSLDPHPQTPHAVLFVALHPHGDIFIYDEIFEKLLIRDVAKKIVEKKNKVRIGWELCDPSAWIENPDTGSRWVDTLYSYELNVIKATKDKTDGIIETQQIFAPMATRRVWIMPHCVRFIKEIKSYFFDKDNKPVDKDDHMMENLYRTVMHDKLTWYPSTKFSKPVVVKDEFKTLATLELPYLNNLTL